MRPIERFYRLCDKYRDPRVDGWPLMDDYLEVVGIVTVYLLFVAMGPKIMEKRKAFDLRWLIVPYNFILVAVSAYIFYEVCVIGILGKYSFSCQPVDYSDSPLSRRTLNIVYLFFLTKIIELADTVFFILRKKNSQVTLLHVYHHASMPLLIWFGPHYLTGGQVLMLGFCNCFIHAVMYFYYALAAIGPHMRKYLTWKRHLTKLQLIQFVIVIAHSVTNLCVECSYPKEWSIIMIIFTLTHVVLFSHFYYTTYVKKRIPQITSLNGHVASASSEQTILADNIEGIDGANALRYRRHMAH